MKTVLYGYTIPLWAYNYSFPINKYGTRQRFLNKD